MAEKIITLSGAAADVLYALFFRGALLSGDLPSKSGTAELRELGFAETRYTATEYQKENHFTFLTSEGQKFALEHLVNTRFGKQPYCASMMFGVEIDTSAAQKAIDELDQRIRDTVSFELIRNGVSFIKDATIANGAIRAEAIETLQSVTNIYNISFGVRSDEPVQNKVTISADKFEVKSGIDANLESVLENALKNAAECAARDVAKLVAADQKAMDELEKTIRKAIHNECLAGGIIWQRFNR
ncbi:Fur-regulated protein [Citrobacter freundii]|uniref:Fur-regulated protein n=1 Tax=Citrobacter freundii TaxID=546 RepID=UPI000EF97707|nr:Fur-regulated protein [Citrobacter freundii]MCT4727630.1 Fur-regulated protein [Citrobacter freundii]MCT4743007.1 Fur-regulated protein [Citrobacter freundii]MDT7430807.1 Fur-regulated protein [Citrobacter freundii]MDT7474459.1 Fur-regulated protein [Citrobacter freundii]RLZ41085.1 Fur-regulated protein [Citrobacter freundii]